MQQTFSSFKFEVFGKVQHVFFRKYTREEAIKLNIKGWVKNTLEGTVIGEAQGNAANCLKFSEWLRTKGSPKSKITKFVKSDEKVIPAITYADFTIEN